MSMHEKSAFLGKVVRLRYAGEDIEGRVVRDMGCIGVGGRRLLRIRVLESEESPSHRVDGRFVEVEAERVRLKAA